MARITIEDCLKKRNNNRFDIIIEAAKRARELFDGSSPNVDARNDKPAVIALREIAVSEEASASADSIEIEEMVESDVDGEQ